MNKKEAAAIVDMSIWPGRPCGISRGWRAIRGSVRGFRLRVAMNSLTKLETTEPLEAAETVNDRRICRLGIALIGAASPKSYLTRSTA